MSFKFLIFISLFSLQNIASYNEPEITYQGARREGFGFAAPIIYTFHIKLDSSEQTIYSYEIDDYKLRSIASNEAFMTFINSGNTKEINASIIKDFFKQSSK